MPLPSSTFDVLLNVESSHLYGDCSAFFAESRRVLKRGAHLCWADLRLRDELDLVKEQAGAGFELRRFEVVTPQVIEGIHSTSQRYEALLRKASPKAVSLQ